MLFGNKEKEIKCTLYDSSIEKYSYNFGMKKITGFYVEMSEKFGKAVGAAPIDDGKYRDGNYMAIVEMENPECREIIGINSSEVIYSDIFKKIEVITGASNERFLTKELKKGTPEYEMFDKALNKYVEENSRDLFKVNDHSEISTDDNEER